MIPFLLEVSPIAFIAVGIIILCVRDLREHDAAEAQRRADIKRRWP